MPKRQALFQSHQQLYSMTKSQNTTTATMTRAKSKASTTKKQGHTYKRKPTDDPIESDTFTDSEPTQLPHRKHAKQSPDDDDDEIETVDDESEATMSVVSLGSDRDDRGSSTEEVCCCKIL